MDNADATFETMRARIAALEATIERFEADWQAQEDRIDKAERERDEAIATQNTAMRQRNDAERELTAARAVTDGARALQYRLKRERDEAREEVKAWRDSATEDEIRNIDAALEYERAALGGESDG